MTLQQKTHPENSTISNMKITWVTEVEIQMLSYVVLFISRKIDKYYKAGVYRWNNNYSNHVYVNFYINIVYIFL